MLYNFSKSISTIRQPGYISVTVNWEEEAVLSGFCRRNGKGIEEVPGIIMLIPGTFYQYYFEVLYAAMTCWAVRA